MREWSRAIGTAALGLVTIAAALEAVRVIREKYAPDVETWARSRLSDAVRARNLDEQVRKWTPYVLFEAYLAQAEANEGNEQ